MQVTTSNRADFREVHFLKLMIFDFFKQVNKYRTIGRGSAFYHVVLTFFQLFYLIEKILVTNNVLIPYTLNIFEIFKYATRFTLIVPIVEMDGNTLVLMYGTIMYFPK